MSYLLTEQMCVGGGGGGGGRGAGGAEPWWSRSEHRYANPEAWC